MPKRPKKKRRLVKGKDWDWWMRKSPDGTLGCILYSTKCEAERTGGLAVITAVKVKLVEVKP